MYIHSNGPTATSLAVHYLHVHNEIALVSQA